jgi:tetratricopeptide (TPR) repeat protein
MHIINTIKDSKLNPSIALRIDGEQGRTIKTQNSKPYIVVLFFIFSILNLLTGCIPKSGLDKAIEYTRQSESLYEKAVDEYKNLISQGKANAETYFRLGRLYFEHGKYPEAIDEFEKSNLPEAKKYKAIAFYKINDFTEGLNIFEKLGILEDDQYLYYYGRVCEELNLYDRAGEIYTKIKSNPYQKLAKERMDIITQQYSGLRLEDLEINLRKIIQSTPKRELYPQASAFILLADEEIEITEEDTSIYKAHFVIKILDERGKKNFSEVVVDYDSTYEKPQLQYARTIKPDGTIIPAGKRHIRDVSKYLNFPLYSNARAMIISMPEITEGATIEYKLNIYKNQLINKKDCVINYLLQDTEPIIKANFSLIIPQGRFMHIKTLNEGYNNFKANLKPTITNSAGKVKYRWEFKDIPQIIPEPNMPTVVEVNPTILISTFNDWGQIYNWWWGLAKDKIQLDTAIKEKVRELTKGLNQEEEKLRVIYNFCAQDIRYVAVEYGRAGYEPHKAKDIFLNKYGDCKDQAILLVTMLKEAGFKAYPVLIGTREYFNLDEGFPCVLFNHCIACVELNGKIIFLDPTAETCSFADLPIDDQERKILIFKEDTYNIANTPLYLAGHNLVKQSIKIEIDKEERMKAQKEIFSFGFYNQLQRAWLLYTQPELIRQTLEETIQGISVGSKLDDYKIDNLDNLNENVVLKYNYQGPEFWTTAGALRIFPQLSNLDNSLAAKESRFYPIDLELYDTEEIYFNISFPGIFTIKYLPEDIHVDNQWLEFITEYSYKDNTIYFRQKRALKKKFISPLEYREFKNFYQDLVKKIKQRIVLEKKD